MSLEQVPYTNYHDLNLDWILGVVKETKEKTDAIDEAVTTATEAAEAADTSAESAASSVVSASQYATNASGYAADAAEALADMQELADNLSATIGADVTDWLETNITQETGYVLDTSLTVEGAAADAKATGDRMTAVENLAAGNDLAIQLMASEQAIIAGNLADTYDTTVSYSPGDYCIYGNVLKKCIASTTGEWTSSSWVTVLVTDDIKSLRTDLDFEKISSVHKDIVTIDTVEDGYYSTVDGSKQNNTSSTNYKRSPYLIPVEELSLYVANRYVNAICYDKYGTFISSVMLYPVDAVNKKNILPAGTAFVGLYATGATEFTLQRIEGENFTSAEYPYSDTTFIHLEKCWCAGTGNVSATNTFDLLIIPNITPGDRYFISNDATYNCICFDASGNVLTTTRELRSPLGYVYTIPNDAVIMYANLYRARTKGVNSEMSDYLVKLNDVSILAIGDSLTWLDGRSGSYGGMSYFSGWQRQLRLAGYDVTSAGFSGYPYATGLDIVDSVDYSIYKEIVTNAYDVSGYDYVILFGGTNDVQFNGALGDRPTTYSNRTFDAATFNGAIGAIISYIRTNNTTAKIILASFPKSEASARDFTAANARVEELKYNSIFWSCKYAGIFENMNVQPTYDGFDSYFYDTTHPNFLGMEIIGKLMLNTINTYE